MTLVSNVEDIKKLSFEDNLKQQELWSDYCKEECPRWNCQGCYNSVIKFELDYQRKHYQLYNHD